MSQVATQTGFTTDAFEAFLAGRSEPDWLTGLRREAWRQFSAMDLPHRNAEEWRRTDIRLLRLGEFAPPVEAAPGAELPEALLTEGVDLGGRVVAHNSVPVHAELAAKWAERGVLFGDLGELLAAHEELLKPYLTRRLVDPLVDKFAALHAACFAGGALLYVPRGVAIDEPLHAIAGLTAGGVDFSRLLVVLEEGAEATLLTETAGGGDGSGLHCGASEIHVGPAARLRFVSLQNWGTGVWHFAHQRAVLQRDAQLQWTIGALGSRLAKVNQSVVLAGEHGRAQVNGVMFTEGKQHLSYHTHQHHQAPACQSDLLYKGALQDRSRIVWRGMIKVDRDAQKTDGYQRNDNLLLSDTARADSIPGLEIEADDVRCTHGATAGRVDEEQIFYAQTRGLTRNEAVRMVVAGFFQQVYDRITIESVREVLGSAIGQRIRQYR